MAYKGGLYIWTFMNPSVKMHLLSNWSADFIYTIQFRLFFGLKIGDIGPTCIYYYTAYTAYRV